MALLENYDTNTMITRYVTIKTGQKINRITQTALDGNVHIQIIGDRITEYSVTAYVNKTGKDLLLESEFTAALMRVSAKQVEYYGRITNLKFSDRLAGDYYQATIEMSKADVS